MIIVLSLTASCSQMVGKRATQGSLTAVQRAAEEADPTVASPLAERASRGAVTGALSQVNQPAQKAELQEAVAAAATAAVAALAGSLRDEWTRQDTEAAARAVSASAIQGVRDELHDTFPECTGPERAACVNEKIRAMSRAATSGMAQGIAGEIKLGAFAAAFGLGALFAALMVSLLRRPVRVVEPAPDRRLPPSAAAARSAGTA
jgi:hypothetical protein